MDFLTCKPQFHSILPQPNIGPPPSRTSSRAPPPRLRCKAVNGIKVGPPPGCPINCLEPRHPPSPTLHSSALRHLTSTPPQSSEAPLSCKAVRNHLTHQWQFTSIDFASLVPTRTRVSGAISPSPTILSPQQALLYLSIFPRCMTTATHSIQPPCPW